jgi:hypothetical protein
MDINMSKSHVIPITLYGKLLKIIIYTISNIIILHNNCLLFELDFYVLSN